MAIASLKHNVQPFNAFRFYYKILIQKIFTLCVSLTRSSCAFLLVVIMFSYKSSLYLKLFWILSLLLHFAASLCLWGLSLWSHGHIRRPSLCFISNCYFWGCHHRHGNFTLFLWISIRKIKNICYWNFLLENVKMSSRHFNMFSSDDISYCTCGFPIEFNLHCSVIRVLIKNAYLHLYYIGIGSSNGTSQAMSNWFNS